MLLNPTTKLILISLCIGYLLSFPINLLIKRIIKNLKKWLKEKNRDRRLASNKIPGALYIGEITQFLDKLKVAVVEVKNKELKIGDNVLIKGKTTQVNFQVTSMQIDRKPVNEVKKGQEAGMLVPRAVKRGDLIYKLKK